MAIYGACHTQQVGEGIPLVQASFNINPAAQADTSFFYRF